jgi:hypothetical protein
MAAPRKYPDEPRERASQQVGDLVLGRQHAPTRRSVTGASWAAAMRSARASRST